MFELSFQMGKFRGPSHMTGIRIRHNALDRNPQIPPPVIVRPLLEKKFSDWKSLTLHSF